MWISSGQVQETLSVFLQACFGKRVDDLNQTPLSRDRERLIFDRLKEGLPLGKDEVLGMSIQDQKFIFELLKQYVMLTGLRPDQIFPADFLADRESGQLGARLQLYIAERSWPFPQQLPQ